MAQSIFNLFFKPSAYSIQILIAKYNFGNVIGELLSLARYLVGAEYFVHL